MRGYPAPHTLGKGYTSCVGLFFVVATHFFYCPPCPMPSLNAAFYSAVVSFLGAFARGCFCFCSFFCFAFGGARWRCPWGFCCSCCCFGGWVSLCCGACLSAVSFWLCCCCVRRFPRFFGVVRGCLGCLGGRACVRCAARSLGCGFCSLRCRFWVFLAWGCCWACGVSLARVSVLAARSRRWRLLVGVLRGLGRGVRPFFFFLWGFLSCLLLFFSCFGWFSVLCCLVVLVRLLLRPLGLRGLVVRVLWRFALRLCLLPAACCVRVRGVVWLARLVRLVLVACGGAVFGFSWRVGLFGSRLRPFFFL